MKFAHMADLHLGGWRDPELEKINTEAFSRAVDICIEEKIDFLIMSGDVFDSSMPGFDFLDIASKELSRLKEAGIPVYYVSGSHDSSPSGKTMLSVFENAGLMKNVARSEGGEGDILKLRFTVDENTGAKLTGIFGRKASLEEDFYRKLDRSIEEEDGYKIFLMHSGIEEFRPDYLKDVPALPLSLLPKGFDYYASGHIHHRAEHKHENGKVIFPGPLFPCNLQELERFSSGGFYIIEDGDSRFVDLGKNEVVAIKIDAENKTPTAVEREIEDAIADIRAEEPIVILRVAGILKEGKTTEINWRRLSEEAYEKGAIAVKRNTNALSSRDYEEVKVSADSIDELEEKIISEHLGQSGISEERKIIESFMHDLDTDKLEGETAQTFEARIIREAERIVEGFSPKKAKVGEEEEKRGTNTLSGYL